MLATKGRFLVAKVDVLVALATILVTILSPEYGERFRREWMNNLYLHSETMSET